MNIKTIKGLTTNLIVSLQSTKKDTLTEIVTAVALAELEETISKMCYD